MNLREITLQELKKLDISKETIDKNKMLYDSIANKDANVFLYLFNINSNFEPNSLYARKIFCQIIKERKFELFHFMENKIKINENLDTFWKEFSDSIVKRDNRDFEMYKEILKYQPESSKLLEGNFKSNLFWNKLCIYNKKQIMQDIVDREYENINMGNLISLVNSEHYSFFEKLTKNMDVERLQRGEVYSMNAGKNVMHVICDKIERDYKDKKELNPIHQKFFKLFIDKKIDLTIKYNSGKCYYDYILPRSLLADIEKKEIIVNLGLKNNENEKNIKKRL